MCLLGLVSLSNVYSYDYDYELDVREGHWIEGQGGRGWIDYLGEVFRFAVPVKTDLQNIDLILVEHEEDACEAWKEQGPDRTVYVYVEMRFVTTDSSYCEVTVIDRENDLELGAAGVGINY